ncbi:hypothetical protein VZT92_023124 [Zoarces viviparus]|uniref:Uncharacterized protein n=1 Tax=Zoarces viviparus TaxID=48416 RepID=A0AAW1E6E1_ZOAVI
MQGSAGVSRGEAIEASVTAATQSPGAQQIPGPALRGRRGRARAWEQRGSHRPFLPAPLTSTRGTGTTLGVCLEKAEPRLGRMG